MGYKADRYLKCIHHRVAGGLASHWGFRLGLSINNTQKCSHARGETKQQFTFSSSITQSVIRCFSWFSKTALCEGTSTIWNIRQFEPTRLSVGYRENFQLQNNATLATITVLIWTPHGQRSYSNIHLRPRDRKRLEYSSCLAKTLFSRMAVMRLRSKVDGEYRDVIKEQDCEYRDVT